MEPCDPGEETSHHKGQTGIILGGSSVVVEEEDLVDEIGEEEIDGGDEEEEGQAGREEEGDEEGVEEQGVSGLDVEFGSFIQGIVLLLDYDG